MARLTCNFFSDSLGMSSVMQVIYPERTKKLIGMDSPSGTDDLPQVLYLLHGLSDDDTAWERRTSIERYVAGKNLVVVMPNVHRSFYSDMKHGYKYWEYISEEIPSKVKSMFKISEKREDTFAAGLSMGGYGAIKLGLACPDKFSAVAGLSGALNLNTPDFIRDEVLKEEIERIYGSREEFNGSINDLIYMVKKISEKKFADRPNLYVWCGTEDFLLDQNRSFKDACAEFGVALTYKESSGDHSWGYWDRMICDVLDWLPLKSL